MFTNWYWYLIYIYSYTHIKLSSRFLLKAFLHYTFHKLLIHEVSFFLATLLFNKENKCLSFILHLYELEKKYKNPKNKQWNQLNRQKMTGLQ